MSKDKNIYRQECSIDLREPLFESGAEEVMVSHQISYKWT